MSSTVFDEGDDVTGPTPRLGATGRESATHSMPETWNMNVSYVFSGNSTVIVRSLEDGVVPCVGVPVQFDRVA